LTLVIPDFSDVRVLVVGDAMLDEYWFGETQRISPEAPDPVVNTRATEKRPGGAANVALNVAALGAGTTLCAIVGTDTEGEYLTEIVRAHDIRCEVLSEPSVRTSHKLRVLARNQQLIRLDSEESFAPLGEKFLDYVQRAVSGCEVVVLSDYAKGTLSNVRRIIELCGQGGRPVLVDPKGTDFDRYRGVSLLTPNQAEFEAVVGAWPDEAEFLRKGLALTADLELEALVVTRGEHGMTLFRPAHPPITLPAEAREVFDVTGAGDTVVALLAAAIGAGVGYEAAAGLANLGAGLVVAKIGVAAVTRSELRFALHQRGRGGRGLVQQSELEELVAAAQARGAKVVMTNGCFDILHAGHVSYLEEAKSLGDYLIVAVNDDASVTRLKGAGRPITPLEDRMAVLAGLAAVDWVVPFSDDTPQALIEAILPDVLVKGGDWRAEDIVGGQAVLKNGGIVRSLAYKPGRSTTELIQAIRR
jgi:D-beta-D-heptose 7-phosphate kinase/D-beta-D-heptose 1-phosphate adenosyltransferase